VICLNYLNSDSAFYGARFRDARKRAGMTQVEVSNILGVTQSHLSMLEKGQRRITLSIASQLCEIYGEDCLLNPLENTDETALSVRSVNQLLTIATKGSQTELLNAVDTYMSICSYVLLRKLYLSNPHNTERVFTVSKEQFEQISSLMNDEPDKIVSYAGVSSKINCSAIEPNEDGVSEFLSVIRSVEEKIKSILDIK
jgi:transcriptional regulator with XRE-family HTH domain